MEHQIQPDESVTLAVAEAVSFHEDRPPESLPPLHDSLRNDLDEIFEFDADGNATSQIERLTFEYLDYYVTVDSEARVSIERKPEDPFSVENHL